jgi:hypothetical protein
MHPWSSQAQSPANARPIQVEGSCGSKALSVLDVRVMVVHFSWGVSVSRDIETVLAFLGLRVAARVHFVMTSTASVSGCAGRHCG